MVLFSPKCSHWQRAVLFPHSAQHFRKARNRRHTSEMRLLQLRLGCAGKVSVKVVAGFANGLVAACARDRKFGWRSSKEGFRRLSSRAERRLKWLMSCYQSFTVQTTPTGSDHTAVRRWSVKQRSTRVPSRPLDQLCRAGCSKNGVP